MKSLLCAKVNSGRVWAQINAVMSGALCRRQKASFSNGLLCGLPTTSTGYFTQVWSFYFLYFLLYRKEDGLVWWPFPDMYEKARGGSVAAEADILNSWERIGFHDRVAQGWGDLQVVCSRLLRVSARRMRRINLQEICFYGHFDALKIDINA